MQSRSTLCLLLLLAVALLCAPEVSAKASHAGWPQINGRLIINKQNTNETIRGEPNAHNELLGGNGNDTIYGGNVGDVIWGDYEPSGQPTAQIDRIYAGNGNNFIYTSHGTNYVFTGTGRTVVHAHFGRGVIHCQSPNVTVIVTHHTAYKLPGCRNVELG